MLPQISYHARPARLCPYSSSPASRNRLGIYGKIAWSLIPSVLSFCERYLLDVYRPSAGVHPLLPRTTLQGRQAARPPPLKGSPAESRAIAFQPHHAPSHAPRCNLASATAEL